MILETERLLLREVSTTDASSFYKLLTSEGWLTYIGDRNIHSVADAEAYIEKHYIPSYARLGYGSYCVLNKKTQEFMGACGLYKRDNLDHPDIGFAFLPNFHRQGYGYEAASAVIKYVFKELNIKTIVGFTLPQNTASINLLKKIGLARIGTYQFEKDKEELLLFST